MPDDDYVSDLDLFRAGWEVGFAANDGTGMAPSADEAFYRLFPDGPTRSAIRAQLMMPLSETNC